MIRLIKPFLYRHFGGTLLHAFMGAIVHPQIEKMMEYRNLLSDPNTRKNWIPAAANEFGRLVNILKWGIQGT